MKPRHAFLIMATLMLLATGAQAQDLHDRWDKLLQAHVSEGEVNYAAIRKNPAELNDYIETLGNTDPANMTQTDQLAFWINAYNAFTVKLIIDNMPLKSIRDIKSPWKQKNWHVGDRVLSLNQIEHEILRKNFKEPRIHFAIVCASIGCPDLQNRAFLGTTVKAQLTNATREFMAHADVPFRVVINEAIELARTFGAEQSHRYVNGVLDALARDLRPHELRAS